MKPYPCIKVFIAFSLCPSLVALFFAVSFFVFDIQSSNIIDFPKFFLRGLYFFLIAVLIAELLYGIPAMAAAAIYAHFHPYKNWRGLLLTTLTGALSAFLWSLLFFMIFFKDAPIHKIVPTLGLFGAATSFVMALCVLPRKPRKADNLTQLMKQEP